MECFCIISMWVCNPISSVHVFTTVHVVRAVYRLVGQLGRVRTIALSFDLSLCFEVRYSPVLSVGHCSPLHTSWQTHLPALLLAFSAAPIREVASKNVGVFNFLHFWWRLSNSIFSISENNVKKSIQNDKDSLQRGLHGKYYGKEVKNGGLDTTRATYEYWGNSELQNIVI